MSVELKTKSVAPFDWANVLREQKFSECEPGTVVRDFETILDFIGAEGVRSTGKYSLLPMAGLRELDERMAAPLRPRLERPQQAAFPHIHGLYLLLRSLRLAKAEGKGKASGRLVLDPVLWEQWQQLNPTEKYFTLFEAACERINAEIVGDFSLGAGVFMEMMAVTAACPVGGQSIESFDDLRIHQVYGAKSQFKFALPELFGLIEVTRGEQQERDGWVPQRVRRTDFGNALLHAFTTTSDDADSPDKTVVYDHAVLMTRLFSFFFDDDNADFDDEDLDDDEEGKSGRDEPHHAGRERTESTTSEQTREGRSKYWRCLSPYVPAWQQSLQPPEREFREGVYQFKVSLGDAWRRIAVPANVSLDSVAGAILAAFDFDSEHLYEFSMRDNDGTTLKILHPGADPMADEEFADEIEVGHLPLREKNAMTFHYNFGADWRFKVLLEKIDPPNARLKKPRVLEERGTPPSQYGDGW